MSVSVFVDVGLGEKVGVTLGGMVVGVALAVSVSVLLGAAVGVVLGVDVKVLIGRRGIYNICP